MKRTMPVVGEPSSKKQHTPRTNGVPGCALPFYDNQHIMVGKIQQAIDEGKDCILESPTGTGKSIAVTCVMRDCMAKNSSLQFVYVSRTHSQLEQCIDTFAEVDNELRRSAKTYKDRSGIHFFGRKHACINKRICCGDGNGDLVGGGKRVERDIEDFDLVCYSNKDKCQYAGLDNEVSRIARTMTKDQQIYSVKDFVRVGSERNVCPYDIYKQYKKNLSSTEHRVPNVVYAPYVYITNTHLMQGLKHMLEKNIPEGTREQNTIVFVIDEAHNFTGACMDGMSVQIHNNFVSKTCDKLLECKRALQPSISLRFKLFEEVCAQLHHRIQRLIELYVDEWVDDLDVALTQADLNVDYITNVCQSITHALNEVDITLMTPIVNKNDVKNLKTMQIMIRGFHGRCWRLCETLRSTKYYRVLLHDTKEGITLSCVNAAYCMDVLRSTFRVGSFVFVSGTLSPLDTFVGSLGYSVNDKRLISNQMGHVMTKPNDQYRIFQVSRFANQSTTPVLFTYDQTKKYPSMYKLACCSIFQSIRGVVQQRKGTAPFGILIFLSNKTVCSEFYDMAASEKLYDKTLLFSECAQKCTNIDALKSWMETQMVKNNKCPVVLCYFRGLLSEGIDLKNNMCRLLFCVGVPVMNLSDRRLRERIMYNEEYNQKQKKANTRNGLLDLFFKTKRGDKEKEENGRIALPTKQGLLNFETSSCVGQALGRVIRHSNDWGCCVLYDERWNYKRRNLPRWMHKFFSLPLSAQQCNSQLKDFFDIVRK